MQDLAQIVDAIDPEDVDPEPSLESANAYAGEDVDLSDEQTAAIDRIVGR